MIVSSVGVWFYSRICGSLSCLESLKFVLKKIIKRYYLL
jgi:hypothetical protein